MLLPNVEAWLRIKLSWPGFELNESPSSRKWRRLCNTVDFTLFYRSASSNLKKRLDGYIAVSDIGRSSLLAPGCSRQLTCLVQDPLTEDEITAIDVACAEASRKIEWPGTRKQWIRAIVNLFILYGLYKLTKN